MDVRCQRCLTEYELEDSAVAEAGTEVQCSACGNTFLVTRAIAAAGTAGAAVAGAAAESPEAADWQLETADGAFHRFRNLTSLQKWIIERKVTREDKISRTGQAWRRLGEIVELAPFFDVVEEADRARSSAGQPRVSEGVPARRTGTPSPALKDTLGSARRPWRPSEEVTAPETTDDLKNAAFGRGAPASRSRLLLVLGVAAVVAIIGIAQPWQSTRARRAPATPVPVATLPPAPAPEPILPAPPPAPGTGAANETQAAVPDAGDDPGPAGGDDAGTPVSYAKLVAEADRLLENGAADRAQKVYERALRLQPSGHEATTGLGYVALDRGHTPLALTLFRRALAANEAFGPALFGLAETHRAMSDLELALEQYRRYVAVAPGGTDAPAARRQIKGIEAKLAPPGAGEPPAAALPSAPPSPALAPPPRSVVPPATPQSGPSPPPVQVVPPPAFKDPPSSLPARRPSPFEGTPARPVAPRAVAPPPVGIEPPPVAPAPPKVETVPPPAATP